MTLRYIGLGKLIKLFFENVISYMNVMCLSNMIGEVFLPNPKVGFLGCFFELLC